MIYCFLQPHKMDRASKTNKRTSSNHPIFVWLRLEEQYLYLFKLIVHPETVFYYKLIKHGIWDSITSFSQNSLCASFSTRI